MVEVALADSFKQAMRRLAATVTVISTGDGSNRFGMTATAVTSVSTDPATLLVCVNQSAFMHAHLGVGSKMCVNLLRHVHADISRAFAGQRDVWERFTVGDWATDADGIPYLSDAQANLFCEVKLAVPYATHTIFIGEVIHIRLHELVAPLIYQDGDYVAALTLVADIG